MGVGNGESNGSKVQVGGRNRSDVIRGSNENRGDNVEHSERKILFGSKKLMIRIR